MTLTLSIYGAGYVGLVSACCFAHLGHKVVCVDINAQRVARLTKGECPIHEENLQEMLQEQLEKGNLQFTINNMEAIRHSNMHIIAVGTPSLLDGGADLSYVFEVATNIITHTESDCVIVIKSTVPVGTGDELERHLKSVLIKMQKHYNVNVISNPEFLREGHAVYDFLHADRVIIGGELQKIHPVRALYQVLANQGVLIQCMSRRSAELTKYAANVMLACRISFMNQISRIAEEKGANIDEVRTGIGSDQRIGPHFLQAGIGYGGSCFPKDIKALINTATSLNVDTCLLDAIDKVNCNQKKWAVERLLQHFNNNLQNLNIGIWGLAFKPGTDDMREASSIIIINMLLQHGVHVCVYDPVSMDEARKYFSDDVDITWCNAADAVIASGIDALVIATEWEEFKQYSLPQLRKLLGEAPIVDGRNCFELLNVEQAGITYYSVGRPILGNVCLGLQTEAAL